MQGGTGLVQLESTCPASPRLPKCAGSLSSSSLPALGPQCSVSCCLPARRPRFPWVQVLLPSAWVLLVTVMSEWGPKSGFVCLVVPALPAALALQSVCFGARGSCWPLARLEQGQG